MNARRKVGRTMRPDARSESQTDDDCFDSPADREVSRTIPVPVDRASRPLLVTAVVTAAANDAANGIWGDPNQKAAENRKMNPQKDIFQHNYHYEEYFFNEIKDLIRCRT